MIEIITLILTFTVLLYIFFLLFWEFIFLRDPKRLIPEGNNIVSPADGKVIEIIKIDNSPLRIKKNKLGKINTITKDTIKKGYLISIFMSVLNVHINRVPIDGIVKNTKHQKGKFLNAMNLALENENNEVLIKNNKLGNIKVIQIAGFLARRINCFLKINQKVKKGQRLGLINLGSQVCLIIPEKIKLNIKIGQKVKAGSTIIGRY